MFSTFWALLCWVFQKNDFLTCSFLVGFPSKNANTRGKQDKQVSFRMPLFPEEIRQVVVVFFRQNGVRVGLGYIVFFLESQQVL